MSTKGKYKLAVGLSYEQDEQDAPSVEVKGEELVADEIVKIAQRYGVPVLEKPELAQALRHVPLDEQIPGDLYEAVALLFHELEKQIGVKRN